MKDATLKRQASFYSGRSKKARVQEVVSVSRAEGDVQALRRTTTALSRSVRKLRDEREEKYHDEYGPSGVIDNGINQSSTLCDPAQGSTVVTRDGDEIAPFRLLVNGKIEMNALSTLTNQQVRVIIIQAKEGFVPSTITSTPTNSAVLYGGALGAAAVVTPYDHNNRKHFIVLMDETFNVTDQDPAVNFSRSFKISRKIRFAEAGSITAERGQLYMCRFSTEGGNGPLMTWYTRTLYHD